jgi:hypothetical protein
MNARPRGVSIGVGLMFAAVLSGGPSCFGIPGLEGTFRCSEGALCPLEGMVCHDGVCCSPIGEPACLGYVYDGGTCSDGGLATLYFEDLDGDSFGNENRPELYCRQPVFDRFVTQGGDCNDNPAQVGTLFYPGAVEQCDGLDNDCDGTLDEGLTTTRYYQDQDQDTFGDPARIRRTCAPPPGYVDNNLDCMPDLAAVHPNAVEICNTLDDDCNRTVDDLAPQPCPVSGFQGLCGEGHTACQTGAQVCVQSYFPAPRDICDGEDNDCDGATDERPDCGGALNFFAADATLTRGSKVLTTDFNGQASSCLKGFPDGGPVQDSFANTVWTGAGSKSHIAWVETSKLWDLTKPGTRIRLRFDYATTSGWAAHSQPVVLLCGPTGHARYVAVGTATGSGPYTLMPGDAGTVSTHVPVIGGSGWFKASGGTLDLSEVRRVELLVQPAPTASPAFTVDFAEWGIP